MHTEGIRALHRGSGPTAQGWAERKGMQEFKPDAKK